MLGVRRPVFIRRNLVLTFVRWDIRLDLVFRL